MKKQILPAYPLLLVFLFVLLFASCQRTWWDEYYSASDERVDMKVWDAIKEEARFSVFVDLIEAYGLDSLFDDGMVHTLFVPANDAFEDLSDTTGIMDQILANHITTTMFLTRNVEGYRKIENLLGKFPIVGSSADGYNYDGIPLIYSSPLYLDGVFYEIADVAIPRPNLYEFTDRFSPVIKAYIDLTDSVFLNKNKSTPIGFDAFGNTIYDSVYSVVNRFERDYFPVSKEFRDRTATFVLFTQDQYNEALDIMAGDLGAAFNDHQDIPESWQNEILLPSVLKKSLFDDMLEHVQFTDRMASITGDTVLLDPSNIDPDSRYLCSNGLIYTYLNFEISPDLYVGEIRIEGEDLVDSVGVGTYTWIPGVSVTGQIFPPSADLSSNASKAHMLNVNFSRNFDGEWGISFSFKNVFPMKYRLEWRASYRPSGTYKVYANGQLLTYEDKFGDLQEEFDSYDLRQSVVSVTGDRFIPEGVFNIKDYWVDNLTEYGDVEIRFEYTGSGFQESNGFNIDYIALVPED